jgi:hypothetical protein
MDMRLKKRTIDLEMEVGDLLYELTEYGDKEEQIIIEGVNTSYTILCFPDIVPDISNHLIQPITPTALLRIQILLSIPPITKKYRLTRAIFFGST